MPGNTARPTFEDRFADLAALSYRVAYRLTGDRSEAEELSQEALTRAFAAWRRVAAYDEAWVARVTTNLAIGRWRRDRRIDRTRPLDGNDARGDRRSPAGTRRLAVVAAERDPLAVVDRVDLVAALRALPRRQRQVVALRYLADLPETAVAGALGCSPGTVKQHAHRGLVALRSRLGHLRPADPELRPEEATRVRAPR